MFAKKDTPKPSLWLVTHPELDRDYMHFQPAMAGGPPRPAFEVAPFDPAARGISPLNAWWLADAALLSYWAPDIAKKRFLAEAALQSEPFDREGTQGYVAWNDKAAIVAFRGTQPNEAADVWSDINFVPKPWEKDGTVHEGFVGALEPVWNDVATLLKKLRGRSVWFAGHSLGAALATLAADRFGEAAGVYTLGSPRVGNPDFVAGFNGRHSGRSFRYVNNHDVVTHVPPSKWKFGHVDSERLFDGDGTMVAGAAKAGDDVIKAAAKHFEDDVGAIISGASLVPPSVIDHTPRRYATFIWNAFVDTAAAAGR